MSANRLARAVAQLKPAMDASLDAVCVVDTEARLVHGNMALKSLFKLKSRDLGGKIKFNEILTLSLPDQGCPVEEVLRTGAPLYVDEAPAVRRKEKIRLSLRAVPLYGEPDADGNAGPEIGAIVSIRDTTGEILLQAKYHKLLEIMAEKDSKIQDLDDRLRSLRSTLRKTRFDSVS